MSRNCTLALISTLVFLLTFLFTKPSGYQFGSALVLALCTFWFGAEIERATGPGSARDESRKFRREKW